MNEEIKSGEGSAQAGEVLVGEAGTEVVELTEPEGAGEAIEEARGEGTEIPLGETVSLSSSGPARFRHGNDRSAIVDDEQKRYLIWAGAADDADKLVDELNANPDSAERFTWTAGDPTVAGGVPASEETAAE